MKKRILLPLLMMALMMTGCTRKIHVKDVTMKGDTAYYMNKPFNGQIWTADDRTGYFTTDNGVLTSLKFFHRNGKDAIDMKINEGGAPITKIYNENGDSIDLVKFQHDYMDIWLNIALVQGELMAK